VGESEGKKICSGGKRGVVYRSEDLGTGELSIRRSWDGLARWREPRG